MKSEWDLFLVVAVCLSAAALVASTAPADEPDNPVPVVVDCNHPRGGGFVGDCAGHCNDLTQCRQCCNRAYHHDTPKMIRWLTACLSRCDMVWPKQEADLEGEPPQIQPESGEIESI